MWFANNESDPHRREWHFTLEIEQKLLQGHSLLVILGLS
jgi:hypothetical protein